jgi:hypothetical protein
LTITSLSTTDIQRDREATLGLEAIAYSMVTYYLRTSSFPASNKIADDTNEECQVTEIDETILKTPANEPFSSVHELIRYTCLSKTIVHPHVTCSLSFTVRSLRGVSHHLSNDQKAMLVTLSTELLNVFKQEERMTWQNIITLDES